LTIPKDKRKETKNLLMEFYKSIKRDIYQNDIGASVSNMDLEQMLAVTRRA